ncbi:MAG: DUF2175 domain-containing protein [Sulfolobus sp.]|nr:DUF2175 domain-containing protein [Sulfolobus sp.]MBP1358217.1 DUF2175 domain-containing protein [Sulfolobus sp.]
MQRAPTKWKCAICGNQIYWDELFTFIKTGVVHYTCFKDMVIKTSKISTNELSTVLDALEEELKNIVTYKQRLSKVENEEIKKTLEAAEKDAEKNAGILTRLVERFSGQ